MAKYQYSVIISGLNFADFSSKEMKISMKFWLIINNYQDFFKIQNLEFLKSPIGKTVYMPQKEKILIPEYIHDWSKIHRSRATIF